MQVKDSGGLKESTVQHVDIRAELNYSATILAADFHGNR